MVAMYRLKRESGSQLLEILITGFWDSATFGQFKDDVEALVGRMTAGGRRHRVFVDVSEIGIQSQPVFQSFRSLLEKEDPRPLKIAFYAPTALSRMQPRRLLLRDDIQVYSVKAAAMEWLES